MSYKVIRYTKEYRKIWDEFLKTSKNYHFIFERDYMEYHADRFEDFSHLIFNDKDKLIAILPANLNSHDGVVHSHQGLTFGGFLINEKMTTQIMLEIFDSLLSYFKKNGLRQLYYKCIPYIYHIKSADEDKYALFRLNAQLIRRDVTTTISLNKSFKYSNNKKRNINKAKRENLNVVKSKDFSIFWKLLEDVLEINHDAKPVHSLEEIEYLAEKFPDNIKLYLCMKDSKLLAGTVLYENEEIVHTQYLANSVEGREIGALDFLLDKLISEEFKHKLYFDFGISNEDQGKVLNVGLIRQKEAFGAKAVVHDFYLVDIK